jgi:hypothetical protein
MEKIIPPFNEVVLWLVVNVIFFLYIGIFQVVNGNGPIHYVAWGSYLSAGAVVLGVIYLLLFMWRKSALVRTLHNCWSAVLLIIPDLPDHGKKN